jgi:trigger factor
LEVATKELGNRQAVLTAKVEEEWLDPFIRTASRRLANRVAVPGFRKGKAPHRIVLQQMGRETLIREVIDELGKAAYDEAVEKSGLEPIQLDSFEITELEPLTLSMTVSLKPTVELGDYRSMPVDIEEVKIEEDDVVDVLRIIQEDYAERVPVERPAALGDFALVDLEGTLEGRAVLKINQQEYELRTDADFPIADFSEKLIAMSAGEERSFSVTFPDDYEDEDLAGREVAFHARIHSLQEKSLPEMDDDLASMVGGSATLDELRGKIREDLYLRREAEQKDELAEKLLDSIAEQAQIDYPPLFLNRELEAMVRGLAFDLQKQSFTLEGYLGTTGTTIEDLLDEFRPVAEEHVKRGLVLAKLVEEEGIEIEDSEIEEELHRITKVYGQDTQGVKDTLLSNEQVREDIRNTLYSRKIVEHLSENSGRAEGEEMEEEKECSLADEEVPVSAEEDPSDPN